MQDNRLVLPKQRPVGGLEAVAQIEFGLVAFFQDLVENEPLALTLLQI
jgi:hypothetical protein